MVVFPDTELLLKLTVPSYEKIPPPRTLTFPDTVLLVTVKAP